MTVTMLDSKGNPVSPEVLWSSSKPQVATVEDGVVTALTKGSTTITCKALDGSGKTAKCTVSVAQAVESLTITGPASLAPGASFTFKAQAAPKGVVSRFTWSVLEGPEGTRITNGRLSVPKDAPIGDTITISAQPPEGGGAGAEYTLTVAPKCASVHISIPWNSDNPYAPLSESYDRAGNLTGLTLYSVQPGEYSKRKDCVSLVADPMDARGRYLDNAGCLRWSSSNPSIVSVTDDGFVQAHKAGTAKITVSALDGSGKKQTVTVKVENPVSTIALFSSAPRGRMLISEPLLAAGKSVSHKVTFAETYGRPTNQKITWSWTLKDSNGWDRTEDFARYIGLTSGGRLSIRSSAQSILAGYRDANTTLKLTVIAQSQDLSGAYDTVTYLLVPPATKLYVAADRKTVGIEPGGTREMVFYSDQFARSMGSYSVSNFVYTSSNPKVASVVGSASGSSSGKDGLVYAEAQLHPDRHGENHHPNHRRHQPLVHHYRAQYAEKGAIMNKRIPIFLSLTALLLSGCAGSQKPQPAEATVVTVQPPACTQSQTEETAGAVEPQLMALTDTEKAAEEIAGQYGITLVSWQDGLALFFTEEDPEAVVRRGVKNGWPELSVNYQRELF